MVFTGSYSNFQKRYWQKANKGMHDMQKGYMVARTGKEEWGETKLKRVKLLFNLADGSNYELPKSFTIVIDTQKLPGVMITTSTEHKHGKIAGIWKLLPASKQINPEKARKNNIKRGSIFDWDILSSE